MVGRGLTLAFALKAALPIPTCYLSEPEHGLPPFKSDQCDTPFSYPLTIAAVCALRALRPGCLRRLPTEAEFRSWGPITEPATEAELRSWGRVALPDADLFRGVGAF